MTAYEKYSLHTCDNLTQPIQMQYSEKQKTFSDLVSLFLKSRLNFESYGRNMNLIAYVLTKIRTPKCVVRQISKKFRFRRPHEKEHGKTFQTLLKSVRQHHYHIY